MANHMKEMLKQVDRALSPQAPTVRPKMVGSLVPPKPPVLTQKTRPQKKESQYKFL